MNEFFSFVKDAGAVATALAAIGGVVYAALHLVMKRAEARINHLIKEATEPLKRNGGSNVGDLPLKMDEMVRRVERIERRQLKIYEEIVDWSDES